MPSKALIVSFSKAVALVCRFMVTWILMLVPCHTTPLNSMHDTSAATGMRIVMRNRSMYTCAGLLADSVLSA